MAIRATTKLVNRQAEGYGMKELLADFVLYGYSGIQPASADDEPVGVNLITFTNQGGAFVDATKAVGTVTLTGVAGQVDNVKVGGMAENLMSVAVPFATDLETTAAAVAASINAKLNSLGIVATSAGAVITLWATAFLGADANGLTVSALGSGGITATPADFAGGVNAMYGMNFDFPAADGKIGMPAGADWRGAGITNGTLGWFRLVPAGNTPAGSGTDQVRFDGTLATSGGDMQVGSLTVVTAAVQSVLQLDITMQKS